MDKIETSPLIFKAPYSVQFHETHGTRWAALLHDGNLTASFDTKQWGGDNAAWEAAWYAAYNHDKRLRARNIKAARGLGRTAADIVGNLFAVVCGAMIGAWIAAQIPSWLDQIPTTQ